jgi:hypothetical protein
MTGYWDVVPRNGLGTASLIVGVLALVTSVSVCGGFLLGPVAIGLGIPALARVSRGHANNGGAATAGIILGLAALVASVGMIVFLQWMGLFNEEYQRCVDQIGNEAYCAKTYK